MDRTIRLAEVRCAGTPATPLGHGVVDDIELRAAVAVELLAVGGADRCLATSVTYARQRIQFDVPIGSFQAIQHRLADMAMDVESARSAAYYAAWCVDAEPDRLPRYAALAKSFATEAYAAAAGEQLQVHGGIGFTWEHDAHRHLKRARALLALHGSPAEHRARLWELIAADTAAAAGA
jgi:alkylation response protein AidB-like acyl-CoA dehydrogenase